MRNEQQVIDQILSYAKSEEIVRAVMLNGSRLNVNAPVDIWQDYDLVFFLRNYGVMPYQTDQDWIKQFGELCIMQINEEAEATYFLMQFKDGVRIDLSFRDINDIETAIKEDSLSKILLDKDNLVPILPEANDSTYHTRKPTQQEFAELLNESFWIMPYIAKGILRDELPYVKHMFDVVLMGVIRKLLCWYIGSEHNWSVNPGYCEKWFKRYLPPDIYNEFIALFPTTNYKEIWSYLFKSGDFIRKIGLELAEKFSYPYNMQDDVNVREFLHRINNR